MACSSIMLFATFLYADLVLAALNSLGLRDNTIIVFTSDNGYHMGEHGHYQKSTLFEDSDRIPLIISYPGMKSRGKTSNSIVEMIDLYPTLSQLAGIKTPGYISGRSFKKVLDDPNYKTRESALSQVRGGYTLRTEKYRYTRWRKDGPNMTELYDRLSDPQEMNNLSGAQQYGDLIKKLDKQLTDRIEESAVAPKGLTVIK